MKSRVNTNPKPTLIESLVMFVQDRPGAAVIAGIILVIVLARLFASEPSTAVGNYDEAEMDAAIAIAQASLDEFIEILERQDGTSFAVKAPFAEGDDGEFIWVNEITFVDGVFHGRVGNTPVVVSSISYLDPVSIAKDDVVDWMYVRDGQLKGNYTLPPLIKGMTPRQRQEVMRFLMPCNLRGLEQQ